jgi:hypothetical protein
MIGWLSAAFIFLKAKYLKRRGLTPALVALVELA